MQTISENISLLNPVAIETVFGKSSNIEPKPFRWSKEEYHRLSEMGLFEGRRTEFLQGEIIEMPTMNSPHATGLTLADEVFRGINLEGCVIRNQMPLELSDEFETVPDIAIVRGKIRDFMEAHPQTAELILEVSDTTLNYDRNRKASLYARFGIQDYWILNLKNRTLEVYRHPIEDETGFYNFDFAEKQTFADWQEVSPLVMPVAKIKIADLLP